MGFLDFIKQFINNGKTNTKIITKQLSKTYKDDTPLEIGLYDGQIPVRNATVTFDIHGKSYERKTDNDGIAKLNINLNVGAYPVVIKYEGNDVYNPETTQTTVYVNPKIETSDLQMKYKDGSKFTAITKDALDNVLSGVEVVFGVNGVEYKRTSDAEGKASLNINLKQGTYTITTSYNDIQKTNNIIITENKTNNKHYGYWVFGKDMKNVDLGKMASNGVTDIFLNFYAFTVHGEKEVVSWISEANKNNIKVHIWMQSFYDGEWINPATANLSKKIEEAKYYAKLSGVGGVHLDYLRYPGNAYKTDGAIKAIVNFAREVRQVTQGVMLTCAVMPENDNGYYYGQDISALGQIMDAIIPMQYKGNYNAGTSWLESTTKIFSSKANIWSGLQAYKSDNDTTVLSSDELMKDANTCLNSGANGVVIFRYGLAPEMKFASPVQTATKQVTRMEGTNIDMYYLDGTKYQCAVYNNDGRVKGKVIINVHGVDYARTAGDDGLYKLPINLNPGTYTIIAKYEGDDNNLPSSVTNTIIIKEKPKETPKQETTTQCTSPYTSSPHPTASGCNGMGQNTSTYCGPSSVHKAIYKFGIRDISQAQLASWMGTGSAGTSHAGIETGIAKINRTKGTNISIQWYNLSDLGWDKIGKIICQPNKAVFCHILYKNGGVCTGSGNFGHYELLTKVNTSTKYVKVINSLGGYCGSCYCGFYQDRTMSCQETFISGISQKSIAVLTMN